MKTQRLFTYQAEGNIDKHKVIYTDAQEAQELINAGKAVKLDLPELEKFERKADEIHDSYKKEVERIKASDNPLLQDDNVQKYELDRLDKEMREQSAAVEAEYQEWRQAQLDDAKTRAARAVVKVTDADKQVAEQFATRAGLQLAGAYKDEKGEAVAKIVNEIGLLSDEERTALQGQASQLLAYIDDPSDKRSVIEAMQDIRNSDLLAVKVAEQLPHTVLTKQRIHDIAKQAANKSMPGTDGVTREFYEKHLKR